jgi:hypothetical protein
MFLGVAHGQKAQRTHVPQDIAGHHAVSFPCLAMGHDFLGHETPQLIAQQTQFFG